MALTLNEEHQSTGCGLGYQMSSYMLMRSLCNRKGLKYAVGEEQLVALKNTFDGIIIDEVDPPGLDGEPQEFMPDQSFNEVLAKTEDGKCLYGYPTPSNMIDSTQFDDVKAHFTFREEIYKACEEWKKKTFGDSEVISMHFRRGDFEKESNGMFLIDDDYYMNALEMLPKDIPVVIFTNDKSYIIGNPKWYNASTKNRFTLIKNILNDNNLDDKVGTYLDHFIDTDGQRLFQYKHAIRYYKSILYNRPESCGPEGCDMFECHDEHPDPPFSELFQYKLDNDIYNYSLDMCLMSMCDYHVMANSTFGLWGVELSNSKKVIYPKYWMQGLNDDPDAIVCDDPKSCRPGFKCNQDTSVKLDLDGYNQTAAIAGPFIKSHWVPLENPDQRAKNKELS